MSELYDKYKTWLTIDVEEITDTNFDLKWKRQVSLDYDRLIQNWIELSDKLNIKATCFVLGSFAQKYPQLIKKLSDNGHEVASHGNNHNLVYNVTINEWEKSIVESKNILEDLISKPVVGYRSASWSLPFEKKYYETLAKSGYLYSSSYFPLKTYMYGNSINKKQAFNIITKHGTIKEIPILKSMIPFSGGLYLRVLPVFIEKYLFNNCIKRKTKPVLYIHPYELMDESLMKFFSKYAKINIDFLLAFYSSSNPLKKIEKILK